ncbi:putative N-acetylglucosaminyl-phosphatidylinositol de-N-acetylase [Bienertia sinuspersici]
MDWFLLAVSAFAVWIASLCKILHVSNFPPKVRYFDSGDSLRKSTVLFIIAHPDDESMFFTPTINHLASRGNNVHILCLSTGNADGMGDIRKDELYKACAMLKVPREQVAILDHPELQDGFGKVWNHTLIAKIVEDSISSHGIDLIWSFWPLKLLLDSQQHNIEAWELDSINMLRKYSGHIDIWTSIFMAWCHPGRKVFCILNEHPLKSFQAMAEHKSQWVNHNVGDMMKQDICSGRL